MLFSLSSAFVAEILSSLHLNFMVVATCTQPLHYCGRFLLCKATCALVSQKSVENEFR